MWRSLSGASTETPAPALPASPPPARIKRESTESSSLGSAVAAFAGTHKKRSRLHAELQQKHQHKSPTKRHKSNSTMVCCRCNCRQRKDHFREKQWEKGKQKQDSSDPSSPSSQKKIRVYCRKCEEHLMIKKQLDPELEKLCTRLHVPKNGRTKFLAAVVTKKEEGESQPQSTFLPRDLILDGYTRADWSHASNTVGWQTTTLRAAVAADSMTGFLQFLKQHQKAAYGRFVLPDKTDGLLCIPFDQPNPNRMDGMVFCKYVMGLGLVLDKQGQVVGPSQPEGAKPESAATAAALPPMESGYSPSRDPEEDYVSSTMLGSLLSAQHRTDETLATVPRGSVHQANNTYYSNDVFEY